MMFSIVTNHKQIKTFRHKDFVGSFIYEEAHKVLELDPIPWEIYKKFQQHNNGKKSPFQTLTYESTTFVDFERAASPSPWTDP